MNNQLTTQQNNTALLKSVLAAPTVIQEFDRALGKNRGVFEASLIELTSGDPAPSRSASPSFLSRRL